MRHRRDTTDGIGTPAAGAAVGGVLEWDDELWDRVWEQVLTQPERHTIAMSVWRRRLPEGLFEARVGAELSRRWRRQARNLAVLYALWTLFWGSIAVSDWRGDGALGSPLTPVCALVGVAAIAACLAVRRRFRAFARQQL